MNFQPHSQRLHITTNPKHERNCEVINTSPRLNEFLENIQTSQIITSLREITKNDTLRDIGTLIHPKEEHVRVMQILVLGVDVQELICNAEISDHGRGDGVGVDMLDLVSMAALDEG